MVLDDAANQCLDLVFFGDVTGYPNNLGIISLSLEVRVGGGLDVGSIDGVRPSCSKALESSCADTRGSA